MPVVVCKCTFVSVCLLVGLHQGNVSAAALSHLKNAHQRLWVREKKTSKSNQQDMICQVNSGKCIGKSTEDSKISPDFAELQVVFPWGQKPLHLYTDSAQQESSAFPEWITTTLRRLHLQRRQAVYLGSLLQLWISNVSTPRAHQSTHLLCVWGKSMTSSWVRSSGLRCCRGSSEHIRKCPKMLPTVKSIQIDWVIHWCHVIRRSNLEAAQLRALKCEHSGGTRAVQVRLSPEC